MQIPIVLPLLVRSVHDRFVAACAGVVNEDIGASEFAFNPGNDLSYRIRFGDVGWNSDGTDAKGLCDPFRLRVRTVSRSRPRSTGCTTAASTGTGR